MRFIPLVLVTRSIPPCPHSANAISADWIHQRRCCVRGFHGLPPSSRRQTHQFGVVGCHGNQVQNLPETGSSGT